MGAPQQGHFFQGAYSLSIALFRSAEDARIDMQNVHVISLQTLNT